MRRRRAEACAATGSVRCRHTYLRQPLLVGELIGHVIHRKDLFEDAQGGEAMGDFILGELLPLLCTAALELSEDAREEGARGR